ncbi:hypothetical protein DM01DRAFT_324296 [Hesseltinella vesiculosa]|uniref:Uncharacterized protein n=1 Tax=Hesseltinella vesiculosa TaxID=101127 RepID=A0A1X2GCS8_9FUNG|nr:hypothetical protein DM01DRAFT_324296 [Hesseltinella vesiculosa]
MATPFITESRVLSVSLFLPYTLDIRQASDHASHATKALSLSTADMDAPRNLIDTLAAQKRLPSTPLNQSEKELFNIDTSFPPLPPSSTLTSMPTPAETTNEMDTVKWSIKPAIAGNIGLQNAIHSVSHRLKQHTWVGTLGKVELDPLSSTTKDKIAATLQQQYQSYAILPPDDVFDGHYNHYCKQVLWPYFHYVMQDDIQNKRHLDDPWPAYVKLNQMFADKIASIYQQGDIVWVNDYHLMLLPKMLRDKLPNAIIGFFMHIPFPSSELFRCLPSRSQLLEGMLQADLVGFQTYSFARHFLQTCSRILSLDTTPSGIQMDSHYVSVGIYPIGIDIAALNRKRQNADVTKWMTMLKDKYAGKKLIVARDKLDYVKGVRQKMLAFEQFLIRHPEWRGKVVLIQIALSTSEENELRAHISDVVSRVNSKFSNISYQPIVFLHQDISFPQYLALLTCADASLITPLRDGMNLTSHEYIVCQEDRQNPLILSEFTGTYGTFGACLRVNPWDYRQIGDAIHEALSMPTEEKQSRWKELYKCIEVNSAQTYATSVISELAKIHNATGRRFSAQIPALPIRFLKQAFASSKNRVVFFDYGGTLVTHGQAASITELNRVIPVLTKLTADPHNTVYVISGRTRFEVERDLGGVPNLGLRQNGFYIKSRGEEWQSLFHQIDLSWKPVVKEIFQYYTERTPGAYIESKESSIVWHYRTTTTPGPDAQYVAWQAAECQNHIADSVNKNFAVHAVAGRTNIEVLPHDVNKSGIANRVLLDTQPDFVLAIGDDRSDEDMFAYLNKQNAVKNVITCTVGSRSTEAKYYISNVDYVLDLIDTLSS